MSLKQALSLVDGKWEAEFRRFVESGDASDEFFQFMDNDQRCQEAVDMVLREKSQGLERVADLLNSENGLRDLQATVDDRSAMLSQVLGTTARLPAEERHQVVRNAVATAMNSGDTKAVEEVAVEIAQQTGVMKVG